MTREDYNGFRALQAKKNKEDLAEYKEMLKRHDWYWRMSDSPKVRDKGQEEEDKLKSFLIGRGKTFYNLYLKEYSRIYKKKK